MLRNLVIPCCCLALICCDGDGDSSSRREESKASTTSQRRGSTSAREGESSVVKSATERFAEISALPEQERDKAWADLAWEMIDTEPESARHAFSQLSPGSREKIRLLQHFATRFHEQDPEQAIEWALALEHQEEKTAAISAIAVCLAEDHPREAARLLSEHAQPGHETDVAAVQVVQRWSAQSPAEAAAWVTRFPDTPARDAGLKIIAHHWLSTDPPAAIKWLGDLPSSPLRQQAARAMRGVILTATPEQRDAWQQFADPSIRQELDQQTPGAMQDVGNNIRPAEEK